MAGGSFPLHDAVVAGDLELVKQMVAEEVELNQKDGHGHTPLHKAVKSDQKEIAAALLAAGANIAIKSNLGETPLHMAAETNGVDMLNTLIEDGGAPVDLLDEDGWTPLHIATYFAAREAADTLLKLGANATAKTVKGIVGLANATPLQLAGKFRGVAPDKQQAIKGAIITWLQAHNLITSSSGKGDGEAAIGSVHRLTSMVEGWSPLHTACLLGNLAEVRSLLDAGGSVHATTAEGHTLLHVAAAENKTEVMKELIARKIDMDAAMNLNQSTAAHCAVRKQRAEALALLIESGASLACKDAKGETPLSLAARKEHWSLVDMCLEKAGPERAEKFVNIANQEGFTALHEACWRGRHDLVPKLLAHRAHLNAIDKKGNTPLHAAAQSNKVAVIRALLAEGGLVDVVKPGNGFSALHDAAYCGHVEAATALLQGGANPMLLTHQTATALHVAAEMNRVDCIQGLVYAGVAVDVTDKHGWTPLHVACCHGCTTAAETLLKLGADPRADAQQKSKKGKISRMVSSAKTPLAVAGSSRTCSKEAKKELEALLKQWAKERDRKFGKGGSSKNLAAAAATSMAAGDEMGSPMPMSPDADGSGLGMPFEG